jgi:hypothetical protein
MGDILLLDQQGNLLKYIADSPRSYLDKQFQIHSISEYSRGFFVGGGTEQELKDSKDGLVWIYEEIKNNEETPYELLAQSKHHPAIG